MRIFQYFVIAAVASGCGYLIHSLSVDWLQGWVAKIMERGGHEVSYSPEVLNVAMFTSIEYGVSVLALYFLIRDKIIGFGQFKAFLILTVLLTALHGALIRQPLMDFLIGNPIEVAVVQNAVQWLVWILMSFVVVYGSEYVITDKSKEERA
ncbi:hypothetical protein [Vibrio sp. AND4]|uniref:hypothetical protein n=1 Tax=Vibrio sp. AND4 TaxID=314289 RepID=UPI00015F2FA4|nr:hypothetical protein [Vibrio sp. AND4]EDP60705.1 hypothetical protein AND4_07294 [Vibrio sp. AND4]